MIPLEVGRIVLYRQREWEVINKLNDMYMLKDLRHPWRLVWVREKNVHVLR